MTIASSGVSGCDLRPPTPPRDNTSDIDDALNFLTVDYSLDKPSSTFECDTTGIETPPKSSPSTTTSSSRQTKRVEFKAYTLQHEGPSPKKDSAQLRPLPQIRDAKPLRSILKPGFCFTPTPEEGSSPGPGYFSPREPLSIPKMLTSVVQSLGTQDPMLRLDGYMTLNNALKAHDDFPGETELREKVPRILQYAIRDLKADTTSPQSKNIQTQALNLVSVLFSKPNLTSDVSADSRMALLDLALSTFGQEPVNKAVANRFLYLLATPEFRAKGLNQQKGDMLVSQLSTIHQRVSGNSVVAARLAVYQRLVIQIPQIMLLRMRDWVEHVFHGCLSSNEDICKRAIQCGMEAGLVLGTHFTATKYVVDLFASETDNDGSFGDYFVARLTDMATNKAQSVYAPQVWSVVIMFFRNKRYPISQWRVLKNWLLVVQRCLNSADAQTRYQALIAWNRLVFVTGLDYAPINPPERLLNMLKIPFAVALDAKAASDKGGPSSRKATLAGYTNLLYYALRPGLAFERLDFFWDFYVKDLVPKMLKYGGMDGRYANRMLKALFNGPSRTWSADRALLPEPVDPDELCRSDVQWLRSRSHKILETLESHFGASLCIPLEQSSAYQSSWTSLVSGIAEASAQEVRASMETREALAHLMNFFAKLWSTSHRWVKGNSPVAFITRFGDMVLAAIDAFGPLAFLQDNIAIDHSERAEPAPTPSIRLSKNQNSLQSPFMFLWKLFISASDSLNEPTTIAQTANAVLYKVFEGQTSNMSRLIHLRQCAIITTSASSPIGDAELRLHMIDLVLTTTSNVIRSQGDTSDTQIRLAQLSRVSIAILKACLSSLESEDLLASWTATFESLENHLHRAVGGLAVNLGLIDPLAETLKLDRHASSSSVKIQLASLMLRKFSWISSRQQLEKSWKLFEGSVLDSSRRQAIIDRSPDILDVVEVICSDLCMSRDLCNVYGTRLLEALHDCLSQCPQQFLLRTLHQLPSLLSLARDEDRLLPSGSPLKKLWSMILASTKGLPVDSALLLNMAPMLSAGFATSHSSVANETISYWNATFGQLSELSYPNQLASVLERVRDHVGLDLPTFPTELAPLDGQPLKLLVLEEGPVSPSQEEMEPHSHTPCKQPHSSNMSESLHRHTPSRPKLPAPASQTPKSAAMPPPKLRHDNSQIEFVNVENLPSELTEDGTQGLTEHQREVKERQEEATRMFPQFSSPVPPSATKDIIRDRIAEVKAHDASGARHQTPEIDNEEHGPMDAFLGSSPSQRSAQRAQSRSSQLSSEPAIPMEELQQEDLVEDLAEVPSSPPELAEEFETAPTDGFLFPEIAATRAAEEESQIPATQQEPGFDLTSDDATPPTFPDGVAGESALEDAPANSDLVRSSEFIEAPTELFEAMQDDERDSEESEVSQSEVDIASSIKREEDENIEVDATKIEDSFVGTSDAGTTLVNPEANEQKIVDMPPAIVSGRGRKRTAPLEQVSSKRQKRGSPIKKLMSWLGGQKDTENVESDMEDCIVVASQPIPKTPALFAMDDHEPSSQPAANSQPASSTQPSKRARGRPRKSTPAVAQQPARQLKRKSSVMSAHSLDESVISSVGSSPRKTRRTSKLQHTPVPTRSSPRNRLLRKDISVVVSPRVTDDYEPGPEPDDMVGNTPDQHLDDNDDDIITPDSQLLKEAAAARAREERLILTPKSIIGRLRNILVDVKKMGKKFVLGSQEERELNGMLFELGGEIHAAGRRNE
ncbi:hypothetical protein KVT40_000886 [Elsinoe batatas]|uniref:Telomere-associated protein Rif1 N-terminal domain-containing protein n=1 Tax=Elsinoe batatas TaxID=2601811 RepID=A0A8K0LC37_9PEZI|nr:hypothetical protein KVT40_000886 [Elsinoe batatas]